MLLQDVLHLGYLRLVQNHVAPVLNLLVYVHQLLLLHYLVVFVYVGTVQLPVFIPSLDD